MNKAKKAAGMHLYTKNAIKCSLTKLEDKSPESKSSAREEQDKKDSVTMFKHLLTFTTGKNPNNLGEFLDTGTRSGIMRNELYCQLLKQLSGNPMEEERKKAWQILWALVNCVSPDGEEMQCVVQKYLIDFGAANVYVEKLHELQFTDKEEGWAADAVIRQLMDQCTQPEVNALAHSLISKSTGQGLATCCCCFA